MQCGWQLSLWCELTPFRILETYSFKIHTHTYKIFVCIYMFLHFPKQFILKVLIIYSFSTNSYKLAQTNLCVDGSGYSCLTRPLPFVLSLLSLLKHPLWNHCQLSPSIQDEHILWPRRAAKKVWAAFWVSLVITEAFSKLPCWWFLLMIPSGVICIPSSPCPLNSQGWQLAKTKLPLLSNLLFPWDLGDNTNH